MTPLWSTVEEEIRRKKGEAKFISLILACFILINAN